MIGELEVLDHELMDLDPQDLGQLEALLEQRGLLIQALASSPLEAGDRHWLRQAMKNTQRIEQKLLLAAASIRAEWQAVYREGVLLRALEPGPAPWVDPQRVDLSA